MARYHKNWIKNISQTNQKELHWIYYQSKIWHYKTLRTTLAAISVVNLSSGPVALVAPIMELINPSFSDSTSSPTSNECWVLNNKKINVFFLFHCLRLPNIYLPQIFFFSVLSLLHWPNNLLLQKLWSFSCSSADQIFAFSKKFPPFLQISSRRVANSPTQTRLDGRFAQNACLDITKLP